MLNIIQSCITTLHVSIPAFLSLCVARFDKFLWRPIGNDISSGLFVMFNGNDDLVKYGKHDCGIEQKRVNYCVCKKLPSIS